ncbi:MAG TPA: TraB/GumN family protein [Flavisolibacter sp.]
MKKILLWAFASVFGMAAYAQQAKPENTLLWRITGKGIKEPSYLFGTIHMICGDDIHLSDSLKKAIKNAKNVYLELDLDNIMEMMGAMNKMKMRDDTTLADLLTPAEYQKVKTFFAGTKGMLPFSMLETFKPILAASTLMQASLDCNSPVAMEQLVMKEAKEWNRPIKGLESMAFQMSIFDSIPYKVQAKQLLKYVEDDGKSEGSKEFEEMVSAYRSQELSRLEAITQKEESGLEGFSNLLLYNRNRAWVSKLETLMPGEPIVIAVGAGHLPGAKGLINLLREKGYRVDPVKNDMTSLPTKEM